MTAAPLPGVPRVAVRVARRALVVALFLVAAVLGTVAGVFVAYADDLPGITALDDYRPNTITRLLAADGQVFSEYATERRVVVGYDDIAPVLRAAIVATEDAGFDQHVGLSVSRILVTLFKDVVQGERAGASTLTQQLARNLFPIGFEKTVERKVKEALLAVQIERRYTKQEIFTFYANQIYFGHGAYGVEAAARLYFGHTARSLEADEAATLAAIIQAPERLSPFTNPRGATLRRNYTLQRMREEGYLSEAEMTAAQRRPLRLSGQLTADRSVAPYFAEEIRKSLEQQFGAKALYETGLTVQTTLDIRLQQAANRALDRGLRQIDKRHRGYRRATRNIVTEGRDPQRVAFERWNAAMAPGDIVPAVVMAVPATGSGAAARIRIGASQIDLPRTSFAWTRKTAADLFTVGDVIEVDVKTARNGAPQTVGLEQTPLLEGAVLAIDNATGAIRAMVGGTNFARSKFNRATQALRQMGSSFKPIIYTAAIERGYTPASTILDEPVSYDVGPNQPPYTPLNYDRTFEGLVTLRRALEDSRNIPAVKTVLDLGPASVVQYATRFGFPGTLPPVLSLALGSAEATLLQVTSAYTAFPNQGVRMAPFSTLRITDREGNVLRETHPEPHEAIRADTAFVMTHLLRGVVQRGTAAAANALHWPLAGKTGTMDEYTDAWFVGFDPHMTVGVWVGYDEKKPIGRNETGAAAALPIWMDVMKAYIDGLPDRAHPPSFEAPGDIVFVKLESGIEEAFISGTEPEGAEPLSAPPPP